MEPHDLVPLAVLEATRSLLRLNTGAEARLVAEQLVRELGGQLVPADTDDTATLPVDVSFGDAQPLLAAAPPQFDHRTVARDQSHQASILQDTGDEPTLGESAC